MKLECKYKGREWTTHIGSRKEHDGKRTYYWTQIPKEIIQVGCMDDENASEKKIALILKKFIKKKLKETTMLDWEIEIE